MGPKLLILCCFCVATLAGTVIRMRCNSWKFQPSTCNAIPPITYINGIQHEHSQASCTEGVSYGVTPHGKLWVKNGCRADFQVQFTSLRQESLKCQSFNYEHAICHASLPIKKVIAVTNRESHANCIEGDSFDVHAGKLWVDKGCRATFKVQLSGPVDQTLKCESWNFRDATCSASSPITNIVGIANHDSKSHCTEGDGYDLRDGKLRVNNGCRATFNVQYDALIDAQHKCESWNFADAECSAPWPIANIVGVKTKESTAPCTENYSYGLSYGKLWVKKGCRAVFNVQYLSPIRETLKCESWSYKPATCQLSKTIKRVVRVEARGSEAACTDGHSYGMSGGKLWVKHGCQALFQVQI